MDQKIVSKIGWAASMMSIAMFVSYIDQIRLNLSGHHGSIILPLITVLNCAAWTSYASLKKEKDWPIILCNVPGIILGLITVFTAI